MSKICPMTGDVVLYLECIECDEKVCRRKEGGVRYDERGKARDRVRD